MSQDGNNSQGDTHNESGSEGNRPLTFFEVLGSTLAAAIGVQSKEKRERDFTRGNVLQFIVAGLIFTVVFIAGLIAVVNLVLSS